MPGIELGEYWRVITGFFFPGTLKLNFFVSLLGLHVCTWYIISSHNHKYEIMIVQGFTMWLCCLLFSFYDPNVMIDP